MLNLLIKEYYFNVMCKYSQSYFTLENDNFNKINSKIKDYR